ncbi:MAG: hypothetical protein GSR72_00255 [Desulfurococcales archaeon]|nr:hypothetical protein [Desulfurococcales archaeon]
MVSLDNEVKSLIVTFLYSQIKNMADKMVGNLAMGIDTDIILAAIGYWKRHTWWGKGILYGAVASIGAKGGFALGGLFGRHEEVKTAAHTLPYLKVTPVTTPGAMKLVNKYGGYVIA